MTIILSLFTLFLYKFDSTQVNRKMYMKCFVNWVVTKVLEKWEIIENL